ncbi:MULTISPECIES: ADP-ribosylglycohydrolase family protein [unclassified Brucella]|uniref:ADP-ribosylglycohydrolase family protein n=1 Tax=unclassified Brucella TaxID=2632610 RepID=UPI000972B645|nr:MULTISPECIES: ADP-ribosylglycohydrolase family protein [unclassified Brucella]APX68552.1 hypothetical protein BKD03_03785 [Brucella sp. 09RB8471]MRN77660.1 hypothetical protein [Brucella sp. 10RB9210]
MDNAKFTGVILGAAFGDALGWPHESRARNLNASMRGALHFVEWAKQSGGKFQPHKEWIPAGSYSDDTQLLIAIARSKLNALDWWNYFASVELPFWTLYERGGGGATIRAAKSWLKGTPPWLGTAADRAKYFNAGGNGAAMRIAPHVLISAGRSFGEIAVDIITDSVITHGHPNAIVGALAYAYALWFAFNNNDTLEYGQLLEQVLDNTSIWSEIRDIEDRWTGWRHVASQYNFESNWRESVRDIVRQINITCRSLQSGALSLDHETLDAIGCFDRRISGSGTVAASASMYLASRYAAGPIQGVTAAAFARGADTDTIASMTGALAGAINGSDWLGSLITEVQDFSFLMALASQLRDYDPTLEIYEPVNQRYLDSLVGELERGASNIHVPLGFPSHVREVDFVTTNSKNLVAKSWILEQEGFQTIVAKKLSRVKGAKKEKGDINQENLHFKFDENKIESKAVIVGIELYTSNLVNSLRFYSDVLNVPVIRRTQSFAQIGEHLVLRQDAGRISNGYGTRIYLQVTNLIDIHSKVIALGMDVSEVSQSGERVAFSCVDPDGRTVELFQR